WPTGYWEILDPGGQISDIVGFYEHQEPNGQIIEAASIVSYTDGLPPASFDLIQFASLWGGSQGSVTEDSSGFVTFQKSVRLDCCDTFYVYSDPSESVPEPITLSLFGTILAGAAVARRRKAKAT